MMRVEVYPDYERRPGDVLTWQLSESLGAAIVETLRTVEKEKAVSVQLGRELERERIHALSTTIPGFTPPNARAGE